MPMSFCRNTISSSHPAESRNNWFSILLLFSCFRHQSSPYTDLAFGSIVIQTLSYPVFFGWTSVTQLAATGSGIWMFTGTVLCRFSLEWIFTTMRWLSGASHELGHINKKVHLQLPALRYRNLPLSVSPASPCPTVCLWRFPARCPGLSGTPFWGACFMHWVGSLWASF